MADRVRKAEPTLGRLPCGECWNCLGRGCLRNSGQADGGTRAIAVRRKLKLRDADVLAGRG